MKDQRGGQAVSPWGNDGSLQTKDYHISGYVRRGIGFENPRKTGAPGKDSAGEEKVGTLVPTWGNGLQGLHQ